METTILIVLLSLAALYMGFRAIRGFHLYRMVRGPLLVICPETTRSALVELAAGTMAVERIAGGLSFQVKQCSRWPERQDCGQDCLRKIEGRFPELTRSGFSQIGAGAACEQCFRNHPN
jgi:hypothetical protein